MEHRRAGLTWMIARSSSSGAPALRALERVGVEPALAAPPGARQWAPWPGAERAARREPDGRHQFRLPPDALAGLYEDAEGAAARGDFAWITRFAPEALELTAIALAMMGNTRGAARVFARAPALSLRGEVFSKIALWAEEGSPAAAAACEAALRRCPASPARERLLALSPPRELQVLFVGGPTSRVSDLAEGYEGVWAAIGEADPETGGVRPKAVCARPPPLGSMERFDLVFVDPTHWMPAVLDAIEGPKVCFIGDLEWHFAHDPARYALCDALVSLGSQGNLEARARFCAPSFVGPLAVHFGLASPDPAFLDPTTAAEAWRAAPRDLDLLSTGRQRHVAGLYADKPAFNRAMMALAPRHRVLMLSQMIPEAEYRALMARARFVASSHRYALGQSWRAFEALGAGAMALLDEASGAASRFSEAYACIHEVSGAAMAQDMARHLERYEACAERFAPQAASFFAELESVCPPAATGVAKEIRLLLLGAALGRYGFPNAAMDEWRRDPDLERFREAQRQSGASGAGASVAAPMVQSSLLAAPLAPWLERRRTRPLDAARYADALDDLALAHLRHSMKRAAPSELIERAGAMIELFPEHGAPLLLRAAGRRLSGDFRHSDGELRALLGRITAWRFEAADARPEWRFGVIAVAGLVDGGMRDGLALARGGAAEGRPALRRAVEAIAQTMLADSALRRSDFNAAIRSGLRATSLDPSGFTAGAILLQALRRRSLSDARPFYAEQMVSCFEESAGRSQDLFQMFAWSAMRGLWALGREGEALSVAAQWGVAWDRMGRPAPEAAIEPWARREAETVWEIAPLRAAVAASGFAL
ncbi:MAG: hypothetical protein AAGM38_04220 [Pseudomonadota bacterium]